MDVSMASPPYLSADHLRRVESGCKALTPHIPTQSIRIHGEPHGFDKRQGGVRVESLDLINVIQVRPIHSAAAFCGLHLALCIYGILK